VNFRLDLIGKGPEESALKSLIETYRLNDRVRILPWMEPDKLWNDADLFVLSSRYEGWGRTIVEAMAAGVPIVTTDVGCVGSFFRPQIDGRVVQPNDASSLASAIAEQMTEHDRRVVMCRSARQRADDFPSAEVQHHRQRAGWRFLLKRDSSATLGMTNPRWDLWVLAFVGFAVLTRLASAFFFHESLLNRETSFFTLVQNWFAGYGYSFAVEDMCRSAYRSPGFLFFLTALYAIFSPENTLAQALVQNAVVVGALWLVYAVGKRLVGKRAAFLGAVMMAVYPYTFYHYTQYYHTFLSTFFLLLLVWLLLRLHESKQMRFAVGSGFGIAALAYVQGTILLAAPLFVLWLLIVWWPDWQPTVKAGVIMAVVSAALIAPWTYRNWTVFHEFVPLTTDLGFGYMKANSENIDWLTAEGYPQEVQTGGNVVSSTDLGYVMYIPNEEIAEHMSLVPSVLWGVWHPKEPIGRYATCAEVGPLSEPELNRYWMEKTAEVRAGMSVSERARLHLQKVKTFWQPALFPSVKYGAPWSFADSPLKVWLARMAVTFSASVVLIGGAIGIGFKLRKRDRAVLLPIAIILVYTALHTFFAGYTKYRIPLDNLLAIYAGLVIVMAWDKLRGRKR